MRTVAIITARAGSKRVPKKNIRPFYGRPMISYAIGAARGCGIFDEVMVSTDSDEIAEIAAGCGAKVPFMRSAKTSDDHATSSDVLREVVDEYELRGEKFDAFCCIYPCVPFLKPRTLKSAHEKMLAEKAPGISPVCRYPAPPEWAMRLDANGRLTVCDPVAKNTRSQDLEPKYFDAGMFYFCDVAAFKREHTLFLKGTLGYVVDSSECQDIDDEDDWRHAEEKYRILNGLD